MLFSYFLSQHTGKIIILISLCVLDKRLYLFSLYYRTFHISLCVLAKHPFNCYPYFTISYPSYWIILIRCFGYTIKNLSYIYVCFYRILCHFRWNFQRRFFIIIHIYLLDFSKVLYGFWSFLIAYTEQVY